MLGPAEICPVRDGKNVNIGHRLVLIKNTVSFVAITHKEGVVSPFMPGKSPALIFVFLGASPTLDSSRLGHFFTPLARRKPKGALTSRALFDFPA